MVEETNSKEISDFETFHMTSLGMNLGSIGGEQGLYPYSIQANSILKGVLSIHFYFDGDQTKSKWKLCFLRKNCVPPTHQLVQETV